jgi:hypothetical protein
MRLSIEMRGRYPPHGISFAAPGRFKNLIKKSTVLLKETPGCMFYSYFRVALSDPCVLTVWLIA